MKYAVSLSSANMNNGCHYCGEPASQWDHIVPKKLGGKNTWDNLIPACSWCNIHKHGKPLSDFREYLKANGRQFDFETPDPYEIKGIGYSYPGGGGWVKFVSIDGRVVVTDQSEYHARMPHYITQKFDLLKNKYGGWEWDIE